MVTALRRTHISHFERFGGTCHITWRLHRNQKPLTTEERDAVLRILRHDAGQLVEIAAGVVMDDHVHLLFRPLEREASVRLLQKWKSISSHLITKSSPRT